MTDRGRGRVNKTLTATLKNKVFGTLFGEGNLEEISFQTQIDKAHILMLESCNLIEKTCATKLIQVIEQLEKTNYKDLYGREIHRGVYFLYEDFLVEILGENVAGNLHLARSRNDIKATMFLLGLRKNYSQLLEKEIALCLCLAEKALEHKDVVMPIHTHYQPALPISYGHYLTAVAENMLRRVAELQDIYRLIEKSPMGAGACGGTTFHIEPEVTATLLGFQGCFENSLDAVASRDSLFSLSAHVAVLGNLIGRISEDFLLWCGDGQGFIELPDDCVGISSMMPNKRNPFLFEQLQGKSGILAGTFNAILNASAGAPYTNSIAVGTEGASVLKSALENACDCLDILTVLIGAGKPHKEKMRNSIKTGYTLATEYANELVREKGFSFRQAHEIVGAFVKKNYENNHFEDFEEVEFESEIEGYKIPKILVEEYLEKATYGFGPAPTRVKQEAEGLLMACEEHKSQLERIKEQWKAGETLVKKSIRQREVEQ